MCGTGTGVWRRRRGVRGRGWRGRRRGYGMKEEEEGSGCVGVGHLGLGQTQMSGGFTVFSNYTADHVLVFAELGWEDTGTGRQAKVSGCWQGKERRGLGGAGVRECGCGVWVCVSLFGAQRSKEGKTRIRSPRVGEAVR